MIFYKKFPMNLVGTDYVVGDIHGAYTTLISALKFVNFNKKTDRLFAVGDLIDRGEESVRVIEFLKQPYVHSVMGNHDYNFCTISPEDINIIAQTNFNGMRWAQNLSHEKIFEIQDLLYKLPIAIEIDTPRGSVGLVHADVPKGMCWEQFINSLENRSDSTITTALEGRNRIHSNDTSGVKGIGRIFVGHSIMKDGPQRFGNVFAIDSGAIFREKDKDFGAMTIANIQFSTGILTNKENNNNIIAKTKTSYRNFSDYA